MSIRAPYEESAESGAIRLPVDSSLFTAFPTEIVREGTRLMKKDEFHVTLLYVRNASVLANVSAEELKSFFNSFADMHSIQLRSFVDDFRYVEKGDKRTIVVRCVVSNLENLFAALNNTYRINMPTQPAHVTLYTLQKNVGIHIPSIEAMEQLPKISLPVLDEALMRVHI